VADGNDRRHAGRRRPADGGLTGRLNAEREHGFDTRSHRRDRLPPDQVGAGS